MSLLSVRRHRYGYHQHNSLCSSMTRRIYKHNCLCTTHPSSWQRHIWHFVPQTHYSNWVIRKFLATPFGGLRASAFKSRTTSPHVTKMEIGLMVLASPLSSILPALTLRDVFVVFELLPLTTLLFVTIVRTFMETWPAGSCFHLRAVKGDEPWTQN
jgi:hypothetical protein